MVFASIGNESICLRYSSCCHRLTLSLQMWLLIITIYIIRTFVGQLMFCAVMNLINNSVDVYNMGAANGLGQSLVALLRAIGPYFSSVRPH